MITTTDYRFRIEDYLCNGCIGGRCDEFRIDDNHWDVMRIDDDDCSALTTILGVDNRYCDPSRVDSEYCDPSRVDSEYCDPSRVDSEYCESCNIDYECCLNGYCRHRTGPSDSSKRCKER
ncbi:hypothetical protein NPIL_402621 [Nephila pilipes]|uniref:Uncharacterized protein n=1 Tax=Nephila pilipes TaxID=299642 RepID=A0A8X6PZZ4_NEPPI|nr:hypothetical protein NPIL_402621 [Nephila pilipes]